MTAATGREEARRIVCIGAAHWDVIGHAARALLPGADVPGRVTRTPGGVACNVARALAGYRIAPSLVAAIGCDAAGDALIGVLVSAGIDCRGVLRSGTTDCYVAIEDASGALHAAVADCGGLERAGAAVLAPLRDGRLAGPDTPWLGGAVLDGNLPAGVVAELLGGPALAGPVAIVPASPAKSADLAPVLGGRPVTLYLNRGEAEALCGASFANSAAAAVAVGRVPGVAAVVTDGAGPAAAVAGGSVVVRHPPAIAARSVTGAGDAFVAAHLVAAAEGCDAGTALGRAIDAAVRHITREDR